MLLQTLHREGEFAGLLAESISAEHLEPTKPESEVMQWNSLEMSLVHIQFYRTMLQTLLHQVEQYAAWLRVQQEVAQRIKNCDLVTRTTVRALQHVFCIADAMQSRVEIFKHGILVSEQEMQVCEQSIAVLDSEREALTIFSRLNLEVLDQKLVQNIEKQIGIVQSLLRQLYACHSINKCLQQQLLVECTPTTTPISTVARAMRNIIV